jgi:hypothetical protein
MFGTNRGPIVRQGYHYLQMDRIELPLEPRDLGVPSIVSKMISEPMSVWRKLCTILASTLTLQTDRNEITHDPRHLEVP